MDSQFWSCGLESYRRIQHKNTVGEKENGKPQSKTQFPRNKLRELSLEAQVEIEYAMLFMRRAPRP